MGKKGSRAFQHLADVGEKISQGFVENRRVMSYAEYLELVTARPTWQLRSAPQYIRACFDHYGTRDVIKPWGPVRRFNLFDCPWAEGRDRLIGHEEVQNRIYRALSTFVSEGVSNKLLLLHGPNGNRTTAEAAVVR